MNKVLVILIFLIYNTLAYCQEKTSTDSFVNGENELKINGLMLILGSIEVNYEYLINDESGLGVDVLVAIDN